MNIEKRLAEIRARKAEIRSIIEKDDKADMDALEKELRELNEEAEGLERRQNIERMLNSGAAVANPVSANTPESRSEEVDEKLYRSAWLKTLQGKPLTDAEQRAYSTRRELRPPHYPGDDRKSDYQENVRGRAHSSAVPDFPRPRQHEVCR